MNNQGHENYRDRAWTRQPVAEQVLKYILRLADHRSVYLRNYAKHLLDRAGVRYFRAPDSYRHRRNFLSLIPFLWVEQSIDGLEFAAPE